MTVIEGHLVCGLGRSASFTQIDWVRSQLIDIAGIDPYPGTVNLELTGEENMRRWHAWQNLPCRTIEAAEIGSCRARCYPVQISGQVLAAVLLPEIEGYPENKVELVAALPVREHLSLALNAQVRVSLCQPLPAKAVLFDIDGTLVDSVGAYIEVARSAAGAFGFKVSEEHVRHSLAMGSNFWQGVLPPGLRDAEAVTKELSSQAARSWPRVLKEHAKVFTGLAQTLDALKALGIKLGIVSGAQEEVLELLNAEGLLDRFEAIVLGSDVAKRKPDPEGIIKCMHLLDVSAKETIYVGDTPVDIQASRAAGVRAVGVLNGVGDSAMLSAYWPDRLVSSHLKLPGLVVAS